MSSHRHYLGFTDYLALYLPHPLRPGLPKDLRPPPPTTDDSPPPITSTTPGVESGLSASPLPPAAAANAEKDSATGKSREGYHVALILTNSGSTARDHLASERTFLAYVRTSLALASTGVALVQLFTIANMTGESSGVLQRFATPIGSTLILLGLLVLLLGCLRYFAVQTALTRGAFPAARLTVVFVVVTLSVLIGVTFGVLVRKG